MTPAQAAPLTATRRWRLRTALAESPPNFAAQLGVPPIVADLLAARGYADPEAAGSFLRPELGALHDPFELKDMDRAVSRVLRALRAGERITVYGDYDVDGVTSTATLVSFLRKCGANVDFYIPKRLTEGYGLNRGAVERLAAQGTRLLVTCDCGVTAVDEVERAVELKVDVVVIDHHRVPAKLPNAAAILNPYQPGCHFPFQHLAAVGVTFNLVMALRKTLREEGWFENRGIPEPRLRDDLDLVALGTVCDMVPLVDENRVFVTFGLRVLAQSQRVGVQALKSVSGVGPGEMTAGQLGFRLGPRINAAGRLRDASAGLSLLLTEDRDEALRLANELDAANLERREIEQRLVVEAVEQAELFPGERGLVLAAPGWHRGVVGIVASRVVERFHRPTLVLEIEGDRVRGSGRSVEGFHLYDALEACSEHLTRFGGHKAAAGLELPAERLDDFRRDFVAQCALQLGDAEPQPHLDIDFTAESDELSWSLCESLGQLAPFGVGNPTPVIGVRGARLTNPRLVGRGQPGHLKAQLGSVDAIGFGLGERLSLVEAGPVDVVLNLDFNEYRGERRVQARLKDVVEQGSVELEAALPRGRSGESFGHVHE